MQIADAGSMNSNAVKCKIAQKIAISKLGRVDFDDPRLMFIDYAARIKIKLTQ